MKALILNSVGGVENFVSADVEVPIPGRNELLIRVRAVGFNPADCKMRSGAVPLDTWPAILGGEVAGVVDQVGEDVDRFRVGDRVCAYLPLKRGGYAEYVCTHEDLATVIPSAFTYIEASVVPLAGLTALMCVDNVPAQRARTVFVAGATGGVGSFLVPLLRCHGMDDITATVGSTESAAYCIESLGVRAERVVRYDRCAPEDLAGFAMNTNHGKRFDLTIDLVGSRMHSLCGELTAFEGTIVSIVRRPEPQLLEALANMCAAFRFVGLKNRARFCEADLWSPYRIGLDRLFSMLVARRIRLPQILEVGDLSVDTVRAAHTILEGGHVRGKLAMSCGAG